MLTSARSCLLALLVLGCAGSSLNAAENYTVDPEHTAVTFKIQHLGINFVHGRFNEVAGAFTTAKDNPGQASFALAIKVSSIDTNVKQRDDHLRSPDFFDVMKFPEMTFKSTRVEAADNGYKVTGNFTMHGVTRSITFTVTGGKIVEFPKGVQRTGFSTIFVLRRSDFGIKYLPDVIGDEVNIAIGFEGTRGGDNPQSKRPLPDLFETLMTDLGLDDMQKAKVRAIHSEFSTRTTPATMRLWNEYHDQQLMLEKMLTAKQRLILPDVLRAMRGRELQALGVKLGLGDGPMQRLAKLRDDYEPKLGALVAPTLKGEKVSKDQAEIIHQQIAEFRLEFLEAVGSELTEAQRTRLPAILRESPGLPRFIREDASLAFVLLAAGVAHMSQREYLDILADKLALARRKRNSSRRPRARTAANSTN